jgi:hypothetical protein
LVIGKIIISNISEIKNMGKIDSSFRDRILLVGAISLVVIFLLDFFRINLTNNVTVVVVIGTGIIVIMYIQKIIKKTNSSN